MRLNAAQYKQYCHAVAGARPCIMRSFLTLKDPGFKSPAMIEITQQFTFDAAHRLDEGAAENRRMHGHSFYVEVTLRGEPDAATGLLRDFGQVDAALKTVRDMLDHRLLNEVEGLGAPTLENLARFIYERARAKLPEVARVKIARPSYGQSCSYEK
jgi:6-pyruvoyltetrahydropterin/6-carboxytetrahydropterin synthase